MMLHDLRRAYGLQILSEENALPDPLAQFKIWLDDAIRAKLPEPNAMVLATADAAGRPSARAVLLKGLDERGFVFFTNYESRKARELEVNPQAALVFNWLGLERQVRVEGVAGKTSREESEAYFQSRPQGSQLGAWVSAQSQVIASREVLEKHLEELKLKYQDKAIPLPPFWGGYRLEPLEIEFWQGRADRLHDRLRYIKETTWQIVRLAP